MVASTVRRVSIKALSSSLGTDGKVRISRRQRQGEYTYFQNPLPSTTAYKGGQPTQAPVPIPTTVKLLCVLHHLGESTLYDAAAPSNLVSSYHLITTVSLFTASLVSLIPCRYGLALKLEPVKSFGTHVGAKATSVLTSYSPIMLRVQQAKLHEKCKVCPSQPLCMRVSAVICHAALIARRYQVLVSVKSQASARNLQDSTYLVLNLSSMVLLSAPVADPQPRLHPAWVNPAKVLEGAACQVRRTLGWCHE